MPEQYAREYFEVIKKRLESSIIRKANKQIRETKEYLGETEAKGLLIIANDNNFLLKPDMMLYLLNRILNNQHSNINSIIYFSANLFVKVPALNSEASSNLFWFDGILEHREPAPRELREALKESWIRHHSTLIPDKPLLEIEMPNNLDIIENINFE